MSKSLKLPTIITKRLSTVLLVTAGVVLVAGMGGIYVIHTKQAQADKMVADKEAQVGSNEQIAKRYQATLDNYNATRDQLRYVDAAMSKESFVPTLVQQLQQVTVQDHLKLTAVRPGPIADAEGPTKTAADGTQKKTVAPYRTMPLSITVEGTYVQVMSFLYHLTKFPKIVSVQTVSFSPKSQGPGEPAGKAPLLSSEIALVAYVFDDAPGTAAAPPTDQATMTNTSWTPNSSNPIATAAGRAVGVARSDMKIADVHDRTQGLLEPAAPTPHSIKGGFASEQVPVR